MKQLTSQIPSKTFLLGEYNVLNGNAALLLNTSPCFTLTATRHSEPQQQSAFHPESPAGKRLVARKAIFKHYKLDFSDPHHGQGGLGASTAHYAALALLESQLQQHTDIPPARLPVILAEYQQDAGLNAVHQPSGADLMAQLTGGVTFFYRNRDGCEALAWPFAELDFCLIRTGFKVATHVHLQGLKIETLDPRLNEAVLQANYGMQTNKVDSFVDAVATYGELLADNHWVSEPTAELLVTLKQTQLVRAVKGCGALGADVVIALVDKSRLSALRAWCEQARLAIIATSADLCDRASCQEEQSLER